MISFVLALILLVVALVGIYIRRAYESVPAIELKRRSRAGDPEASTMYLAAAYGESLSILLVVIVVLAVAGSFVLFSVVAPPYLAFIIDLVVILLGFFWLPASRPSSFGRRLAIISAPSLAYILHFVHPTISYSTRVVRKKPRTRHTGVFEKNDLGGLLEAQRHQSDSRISVETLDMLEQVLGFDDKLVREAMTPRRKVIMANAGESATPVIIRDLHETGHVRFPVFEGVRDNIVGVLNINRLTDIKAANDLSKAIEAPVHYIHEEASLSQAVEAYLKTGDQLMIAINDAEQYVGIITVEDILGQIIGHKSPKGFSHYDDPHAVAQYQSEQNNPKDTEPHQIDSEPSTDTDSKTVVK